MDLRRLISLYSGVMIVISLVYFLSRARAIDSAGVRWQSCRPARSSSASDDIARPRRAGGWRSRSRWCSMRSAASLYTRCRAPPASSNRGTGRCGSIQGLDVRAPRHGHVGLARSTFRGVSAAIDFAIIVLGAGLIGAIVIALPYANAATGVVGAVRVLLCPPRRSSYSRSWSISRPLFAGHGRSRRFSVDCSDFVTYDSLYRLARAHGERLSGAAIDLGLIAFFVLIGAAALPPSMKRLNTPLSRDGRDASPVRLGTCRRPRAHAVGGPSPQPVPRTIAVRGVDLRRRDARPRTRARTHRRYRVAAAPSGVRRASRARDGDRAGRCTDRIRDPTDPRTCRRPTLPAVGAAQRGDHLGHDGRTGRTRSLRPPAPASCLTRPPTARMSTHGAADGPDVAVPLLAGRGGGAESPVADGGGHRMPGGAGADVAAAAAAAVRRCRHPVAAGQGVGRTREPRDPGRSRRDAVDRRAPTPAAPPRPSGPMLVVHSAKATLNLLRPRLETLATQAGSTLERIRLNEDNLRHTSESYFRTLVQNSADVILILDDDDRVRYASPSAHDVFGPVPISRCAPADADRRARPRPGRATSTTGSSRRARTSQVGNSQPARPPTTTGWCAAAVWTRPGSRCRAAICERTRRSPASW